MEKESVGETQQTALEGELLETVVEAHPLQARLAKLLSVKSLVTLALTGVFAYQACTGQVSQDFMTVYAVVIAFYFGTQSQKFQNSIAE